MGLKKVIRKIIIVMRSLYFVDDNHTLCYGDYFQDSSDFKQLIYDLLLSVEVGIVCWEKEKERYFELNICIKIESTTACTTCEL